MGWGVLGGRREWLAGYLVTNNNNTADQDQTRPAVR